MAVSQHARGMNNARVRPLLSAKLMTPRPGATAVVRTRLHERLDAAWCHRLTTVVAPAGWGKSTLLATWAQDLGHERAAWLSLDEADDEPVRFWTYALSTLSALAPEVPNDALSLLGAPGFDPLQAALAALLNSLTDCADEYVLILDDYHVLADPVIHESVEFLLTYLPPALHLVIASRTDPPLPLARMRARGELVEVRVADLRCTPAEGAALIAAVADRGAPATTTVELVSRTEGWPAGLQLAGLALRGSEDPATAAADIRGDQRHILDYFREEVIPGLDHEQQHLLAHCSVLERLSGQLCDAVLGTTGSADVLERLDRGDLFVTALGDGWYRCHRLFRDVLRRELDRNAPDAGAAILPRASDWFLEQGQIEEAVEHRLLARDDAGALDLILSHGWWFLDHGAIATLLRVGEQLAVTVGDPRLHLTLAFAAGLSGQPDRSLRWLQAAEPLIEVQAEPLPGWRSLRAGADTVWATYGVPGQLDEALRYARRAAELESDPAQWGYVGARIALAGALLGADRSAEAVDVLQRCWRAPVRRQMPVLFLLQAGGQLAIAMVQLGDLDGASRVAIELADTADAAEQAWGVGAAPAVAVLRLAEGRLAMARDPNAGLAALQRAVDLAESWGRATVLVASLTSLAAAQWGTGDRAGARLSIDRAREAAEDEQARPLTLHQLDELQARIGRRASKAARTNGELLEELTDRELAVLRALRGPLSAREIATEMYLSMNTVKSYTKSLYRKLGVVTRAEAVRRAHEVGLI